MLWILIVAVSLLAAPYVVWPVLVRLLRRRATEPRLARAGPLPRISILIPAHNEAAQLTQRLANLEALDYPKELLEVWVASDGSTDGTAEIAANWSGSLRPVLARWAERKGKAWTLNQLVRVASNELVLLTDASALLAPGALRLLVAAIEQPGVGAAIPRYVTTDERGASEGQYWKFATWLRQGESRAEVLHAAHGAAWLARKSLLRPLPEDTINDDVALALGLRERGARLVYEPLAVVFDAPTASWVDVFYRLRRIARGNVQLLRRSRHLLSPRVGRLAVGLWLQRVLKLTGPLWLLIAAGSAVVAGVTDPSLRGLASAVVAALGAGAISLALRALGVKRQGPLGVLGYGLVGQVATGMGLIDAALGRHGNVWQRPEVTVAASDLERPAPVPLRVRFAKRAFDLVLAIPTLLLLSPLLLVLAALVRLTSKGPAFFRQERVGLDAHGRPTLFKMLKFRSMGVDAEARSGPVWASREDPRITPLGSFLRKARLDELPQLLNVVRGEMSLVGPRPERPFFVDQLQNSIPGYADRVCRVKPGISGWAQVNCEYDTSLDSVREKLLFDLTYAAHLYSLRTWLRVELGLVFRTIVVMVRGKGAH